MALDPGQLVTAVSTGVVLGLAKALDVLTKRKRRDLLSRQLDRLEAKVDCLNEAALELEHRLSRIESELDITPSVRAVRSNGARG